MSKFDDLVNSVGVGDDGISVVYPDTFLADIQAAYVDDMSIPQAKIDVLMAENAELAVENTALKAHNYELIMAVPAADTDDITSSDSDESDDDEDVDFDDFFGNDSDDDK